MPCADASWLESLDACSTVAPAIPTAQHRRSPGRAACARACRTPDEDPEQLALALELHSVLPSCEPVAASRPRATMPTEFSRARRTRHPRRASRSHARSSRGERAEDSRSPERDAPVRVRQKLARFARPQRVRAERARERLITSSRELAVDQVSAISSRELADRARGAEERDQRVSHWGPPAVFDSDVEAISGGEPRLAASSLGRVAEAVTPAGLPARPDRGVSRIATAIGMTNQRRVPHR